MAARRPLIEALGVVQELPAVDTLTVATPVAATDAATKAYVDSRGVLASLVATRIRRSTDQAIPTGAGFTNLSWDTSAYQAGGVFWTSGTTVTIPETGYYQVFAEGTFDGTGLLGMITANMQVLHNNTTVIGEEESTVAIGAKVQLFCMAQRNFTAGDTLLTQVKHSNATSVNMLAQGDHSPDIILTKIGGVSGDPNIGMILTLSQNCYFN